MFKPPKNGFGVNTFDDRDTCTLLTITDEDDPSHQVFIGRVQAVPAPVRYVLYCHGNMEVRPGG